MVLNAGLLRIPFFLEIDWGGHVFSLLATCLSMSLSTGSFFGRSRRKSGGGAELPQQQAKDCDCLFWQLDKV